MKVAEKKTEGMAQSNYRNYTIRIYPDTTSDSPRRLQDLNATTILMKQAILSDDLQAHLDLSPHKISMQHGKLAIIYTLEIGLAPKGIAIRKDELASGKDGYIFITNQTAIEEYGEQYTQRQLKNAVDTELEMFNCYLQGWVCRYEITNSEGVIVEQAGGFYNALDALAVAREDVDCLLAKLLSDGGEDEHSNNRD